MEDIKNIVVIGGGFAGVNLINHLANKKRYPITLVDKNNYNFFPHLAVPGTVNTIPGDHSPRFAPVLHPTLKAGLQAMMTAAAAWLNKS